MWNKAVLFSSSIFSHRYYLFLRKTRKYRNWSQNFELKSSESILVKISNHEIFQLETTSIFLTYSPVPNKRHSCLLIYSSPYPPPHLFWTFRLLLFINLRSTNFPYLDKGSKMNWYCFVLARSSFIKSC